jgi:hypothetical protein
MRYSPRTESAAVKPCPTLLVQRTKLAGQENKQLLRRHIFATDDTLRMQVDLV